LKKLNVPAGTINKIDTIYTYSSFTFSRAHLTSSLTHEILHAIEPLLPLSSPSKSTQEECVLTDDDQLYLYEVVGIVIVSGEQTPQVS